MTIGVVSYQGDVERHERALLEVDERIRVVRVRRPEELASLDGIVIPGGESTTIGMLMERFGLLAPLRIAIDEGLPTLATCAGTILLAESIVGSRQVRIGCLPISVERNAYGRQVDSFEADLAVSELGEDPLRAVFIRAPKIVAVEPAVGVLARFEGAPVIVEYGSVLALTFHPEMTSDRRVHRRFIERIAGRTAG